MGLGEPATIDGLAVPIPATSKAPGGFDPCNRP